MPTIDRSTVWAIALAGGYGVLAATYIVVSGSLAADTSATVDELQRIETWKGIVFVGATMAAAFAGTRLAIRRIDRDAEELVRCERALVATQGKVFAGVMAASVAHDANNVLTAVLADLDAVATEPEPARQAHLVQLRASVDRLVALNRRLLVAARNNVPKELQPTDLARLVRDCVASVRAHRSLLGRRLVCEGDASVPVATQPLLVHQIVANLLLNAGEATAQGGRVEIVTRAHGGGAVLEVHDDGPGIPEERLATLFTALTTTKEHGTGLGLFSARACAQALGGDLEVGRSHLGGAMVRMRLPRSASAS